MAGIIEWARTAPADDFWITAAVLVGLTVAGFIGAFYYFLRKRIIEDTPTSRIRSAAQGYVELTGIGKLMEAPPSPRRSREHPAPGTVTRSRNAADPAAAPAGSPSTGAPVRNCFCWKTKPVPV